MGFKNNGLIRSLRSRFKRRKTLSSSASSGVTTVARSDHGISRKNISKDALKVMYRLQEQGFAVYLVGGSVRDLLLARKPKDFDVVTDASPEQIRKIFRNSRIIGRRFKLVHVYFKDEIIEVSTFRATHGEATYDEAGIREGDQPLIIRSDNVFGTIEEDAWRRDFSVNALFYNVDDFSVLDYTGGMEDLGRAQIRIIGDPSVRFHEDPVRLLRAIRLAAKLNFSIEENTDKSVGELRHLLTHVPKARLLDEVGKLFFEGFAKITYAFLEKKDYIQVLFPALDKLLKEKVDSTYTKLIHVALSKTDERFKADKRLTPGFLLAAFLWPVVQDTLEKLKKEKARFFMAIHQAMRVAIEGQAEACLLTKRMKNMMMAVWFLQYHLERRKPKRILHLLKHRYFRAAFDLLELRFEAGEVSSELYTWWKEIQVAKPKRQQALVDQLR